MIKQELEWYTLYEKSPPKGSVLFWAKGYMYKGIVSNLVGEKAFFTGDEYIAFCWVEYWATCPKKPKKS